MRACLNHALFYFSYYLFTFAVRIIIYELMKKLLFIVLLALLSLKVSAQALITDADGRYPVYCTILCFNSWGEGKISVNFDFGGGERWTESTCALLDDKGKRLKFTSPMGAVNYFAKRGWKFVPYAEKSMTFIMVKYIKSDSEITEGINFKPYNGKIKKEKTGDDMFDAGIEE